MTVRTASGRESTCFRFGAGCKAAVHFRVEALRTVSLTDDGRRQHGGEEEEVEERRVVHQDHRGTVAAKLLPVHVELLDANLRIEQQHGTKERRGRTHAEVLPGEFRKEATRLQEVGNACDRAEDQHCRNERDREPYAARLGQNARHDE